MAPSRLGIFGGSFDPVHLGHLLAAQDALEQVDLDQVIFMPAARAPLKDRGPGATGEQRLALLRAAIAGDERFSVSTLELERSGVSYTIDTVRALRKAHRDAELFWIIGADQAGLLPQWREIAALGELIQFIVLARPGFGLPPVAHRPSGLRLLPVAVHEFAISSSEIRLRLAARKPVRLFLPAPVADLIERGQHYRPTTHAHTA
jgi:nicotinate-nucleotide adenylyltransferase